MHRVLWAVILFYYFLGDAHPDRSDRRPFSALDVLSFMIGSPAGHSDIDLCANPEAICQHEELKWVGALHYWTTIVQQSGCFHPTLAAQAAAMGPGPAPPAVPACYDFPRGVGGSINNGYWNSHAHGEAGRLRYFDALIAAMRTAAEVRHLLYFFTISTAS